MNLIKNYIINIWISFVLFLQLFNYSFKLNILFQLLSLISFVIIYKPTINKNIILFIKPIIWIVAIGMIGFFLNKHKLFEAVKDVLHLLKPIIGLLIGFLFVKRLKSEKEFFRLIIYAGIISALYHFVLLFGFSKLSSGDIGAYRMNIKDNFLELISFFFLLVYKKKFGENFLKINIYNYLVYFLFIVSMFLYFSRTMIIVAFLIWFSIIGFTKITKTNLKIMSVFILLILLLYLYLFSIKIDRSAKGFDGLLYKIKIAPSEIFNAKIDRENHAHLWDRWRAYEVKRALSQMNDQPISYIFGMGYGALVNLRFWAPLGDSNKGMKYIPEIHNGYIYVLFKTGIIGILFYLYFLMKIYLFINKENSFNVKIISGIGLSYIFTTLIITGIYNARDILIFILGGLMYFYYSNKHNYSKINYS